jgi:hypothetical protein
MTESDDRIEERAAQLREATSALAPSPELMRRLVAIPAAARPPDLGGSIVRVGRVAIAVAALAAMACLVVAARETSAWRDAAAGAVELGL